MPYLTAIADFRRVIRNIAMESKNNEILKVKSNLLFYYF